MSFGLTVLPVNPRMTDKADSCGELSTAVITGKGSWPALLLHRTHYFFLSSGCVLVGFNRGGTHHTLQ